jgi:hypothetical protein
MLLIDGYLLRLPTTVDDGASARSLPRCVLPAQNAPLFLLPCTASGNRPPKFCLQPAYGALARELGDSARSKLFPYERSYKNGRWIVSSRHLTFLIEGVLRLRLLPGHPVRNHHRLVRHRIGAITIKGVRHRHAWRDRSRNDCRRRRNAAEMRCCGHDSSPSLMGCTGTFRRSPVGYYLAFRIYVRLRTMFPASAFARFTDLLRSRYFFGCFTTVIVNDDGYCLE